MYNMLVPEQYCRYMLKVDLVLSLKSHMFYLYKQRIKNLRLACFLSPMKQLSLLCNLFSLKKNLYVFDCVLNIT